MGDSAGTSGTIVPHHSGNETETPGSAMSRSEILGSTAVEAYSITFLFLFSFSGIMCIVLLCNLRKRGLLGYNLPTYSMSLVFLLCLDRTLFFAIDPHLLGFPTQADKTLVFVLFGLAFPLIQAAVALIILYLYEIYWHVQRMTSMDKFLPRMKPVFYLNMVMHFIVQFVTDVLSSLNIGNATNFIVCHLYFILWGLFAVLCLNILVYNIFSEKEARSENHTKMCRQAKQVTLMLSFASMWTMGMGTYAFAVGMETLGSEPWMWLRFQITFRVAELVTVFVLFYVNSHSLRVTMLKKLKRGASSVAYALPRRRPSMFSSQGSFYNKKSSVRSMTSLKEEGNPENSPSCQNDEEQVDVDIVINDATPVSHSQLDDDI